MLLTDANKGKERKGKWEKRFGSVAVNSSLAFTRAAYHLRSFPYANDGCAGHSCVVGKFYLITVRTLILYAWSLASRSVDLEALSETSREIRAGGGAVRDKAPTAGLKR